MLLTLHEDMNPLAEIHTQGENENRTARLRQHRVVLRIRQLQSEKNLRGSLSLIQDTEMITLQDEANKNNWLYW